MRVGLGVRVRVGLGVRVRARRAVLQKDKRLRGGFVCEGAVGGRVDVRFVKRGVPEGWEMSGGGCEVRG